jgi:hypothetical protein
MCYSHSVSINSKLAATYLVDIPLGFYGIFKIILNWVDLFENALFIGFDNALYTG